jgi:DNA-binding transcriptional LysR family regulator
MQFPSNVGIFKGRTRRIDTSASCTPVDARPQSYKVHVNQLQAMRIFLRVAENNSFSRAAASLDLSNAAVTRYMSLLEAHLNTRLVNRTTRSLSLTEAGQLYARGCKQVLELVDSIESAVESGVGETRGTLKLVASAAFALAGLPPLLKRYCQLNPKVRVDVTLLHRNVNLVEDGFEVGIVTSSQVSSGTLVSRPLTSIQSTIVASPAYLKVHGAPAAPAQLAARALLVPARDMRGNDWCFVDRHGNEQTVNLDPICTANDMIMLRQLVLANMGLAILPAAYVREDIQDRTLIPVLREYEIADGPEELCLVYPSRRHLSAKVRAFIELALEHLPTSAVTPDAF